MPRSPSSKVGQKPRTAFNLEAFTGDDIEHRSAGDRLDTAR